ncbi:MAG: hypothetical protein CTY17_02780 [Methylomonas sp.]|nr:MAG: hypothetical protein CTY23_00505 [Methylomonas sp.]PPD41821.1 MAG: hypothetical protein CTY17_02780 [Methylomonas sp.]PPD51579.1 MAG: hypothetical protein CTY11_11710 [Methylomonas sp.]
MKAILKDQFWRISQFSGRSGWIIQQIVKMNYPSFCDARYALMIDSDCLFFRDFDESDFIGTDDKKILLKQYPESESGMHRLYINGARKILKLAEGPSHFHYMAYPSVFFREYVLSLQQYIEQIYSDPWQKVFFDIGTISEHSIYGIFVEEVLKPKDLKIRIAPFNIGIWTDACLENSDLILNKVEQIIQKPNKHEQPFCLTIQSNIGHSTDKLRLDFIDKYLRS